MTLLPDLINGMYEAGGGFMQLLNVKALYKDKKVIGVSIVPSAFFTSWGIWNLFYYPHLGQWLSFAGGLVLVLVNVAWVCMAIYYARKK